MPMPVVTLQQRRARLATRHRLAVAQHTDSVPAVADAVVALHATDPATVYLSAAARMRSPSIDAVAAALHTERTLVRHHGMRRTVWVCTPEVGAARPRCLHGRHRPTRVATVPHGAGRQRHRRRRHRRPGRLDPHRHRRHPRRGPPARSRDCTGTGQGGAGAGHQGHHGRWQVRGAAVGAHPPVAQPRLRRTDRPHHAAGCVEHQRVRLVR